MESKIRQVNPKNLTKSRCNMRNDEPEDDETWFEDFVENIGNEGIKKRPIARMEDGEKAVVDGWHRVRAAQEANIDTIEVDFREEMDDEEALSTSFIGNEKWFKQEVDPYDRALLLNRLWEEHGDGGLPSSGDLAEMLSVPDSTVNRWLEPLRHEWEDTAFDPTSETLHNPTVGLLQSIGIKKLRSIRRTTDGGELGEWLAEKTHEENLTIKNLADIREYVEKGASVEAALDTVTGDAAFEDLDIGVETTDDEDADATDIEVEGVTDTTTDTDDTSDEDGEEEEEEGDDKPPWLEPNDPDDPDEVPEEAWSVQLEDHDENEEVGESEVETDSVVDDDSDDEASVTITLSYEGEIARAILNAADDFNADDPSKVAHAAMERWLRDGQYIPREALMKF